MAQQGQPGDLEFDFIPADFAQDVVRYVVPFDGTVRLPLSTIFWPYLGGPVMALATKNPGYLLYVNPTRTAATAPVNLRAGELLRLNAVPMLSLGIMIYGDAIIVELQYLT